MASESARNWAQAQDNKVPLGTTLSRAKLKPLQRDEIRRRLGEGESVMDLALEFNVSADVIRRTGAR